MPSTIHVDFTDAGVSAVIASAQAVQGHGRRQRCSSRRHAQGRPASAPGRVQLLRAVTAELCASTSSISTCPTTGSRCARPSRATRRGCWSSSLAQRSTDRIVRDLPSLLEPGDVLVFNDTKVIPAQLSGIRRRGEALAQIDATLHMRVGAGPLEGLRAARPSALAVGDRISFGHDGNACFLGARRDRRRKGRGRRGDAAFDLVRRVSRRGDAGRRPYSAAALYRLEAPGRRARPHRLPDHLRARRGRRRGADGRPAFHAGAVRGARCNAASSASS